MKIVRFEKSTSLVTSEFSMVPISLDVTVTVLGFPALFFNKELPGEAPLEFCKTDTQITTSVSVTGIPFSTLNIHNDVVPA